MAMCRHFQAFTDPAQIRADSPRCGANRGRGDSVQPSMRKPRLIHLIHVIHLVSLPLLAQGAGEIDLPRLTGTIHLDGVLDDEAWRGIPPLPLTMHAPVFRGTPGENTEIRVAYDDGFVYVYGRFDDSHAGDLRINSLYRDRYSNDDAFAIYIDTFNDNENALWFLTNPAGTRMDFSISNDGNSWDDSWNAVWDVATKVTDRGWTVEMRIPLSSMRFQEHDGRVVMGMAVTRLVARTNERVTWPAIDPRYGFRQPSVFQDVVLHGIQHHRPAYVTPYVLGGADRSVALPPGGLAFAASASAVHEAGGDLKYAISDNVNLDLSLNTDFAQVEADDQQLNLTRFPLFFPEKRQFFQERAGIFSFDFKNGGRLFHSRNIGLAPDGTPLRLLGGARLVARSGGWDLGVLDMQTARNGVTPTENLGVARVRRRILNENSYAGAMLTSRRDDAGHYNVATGLDASVRVFGTDYVNLRGASTFDDAEVSPNFLGRSQVFAEWERRGTNGLTYTANYQRAGAQYQPDLGFLPRQDFTRATLYAQYNHLQGSSRTFRSHGPGAIAFAWFRNSDHKLETAYGAYWWLYEFRSGANGFLEFIHNYEDVPVAFSLGDGVGVQPGIYRFLTVWFQYEPPTGSRLRTGFDARMGGFYDGYSSQFTFTPTWNLSRHLELGASYQVNVIRFPDRHTGLTAHVARLRVGAAASAKLSATAIAQINSVTDRFGLNLRLRYNLAEGRDIWLVYNEGLNTDQDDRPAGTPLLPLSDARALRLKATWMLVL
jgi:hypothetical protein